MDCGPELARLCQPLHLQDPVYLAESGGRGYEYITRPRYGEGPW